MDKIVDIKVVENEYESRFQMETLKVVQAMQEKGFKVEIKYSTTHVGTFNSMRHSAMIIGKV